MTTDDNNGTEPITRADLRTMTAEAIDRAYRAGELGHLLGHDPVDPTIPDARLSIAQLEAIQKEHQP